MPPRHRTESKTSPRRIRAVEKQRRALELRSAGLSYAIIARELGYRNHTSAMYAVNTALAKTLAEPADHYRKLTLERLTVVLRTFWGDMVASHERGATLDSRAKAGAMVLKTLDSVSKLLGLEVPIPITGPGGGPLQIRVVYDEPPKAPP